MLLLFFLILNFNLINSQSRLNTFLKPSDTLNTSRRNAVLISESLLFVAGIVQLNKIYAKDYFDSKCDFVNNDSKYLQMDKAAHSFVSYQMGSASVKALKWSGVSRRNQLLYGSGIGFVFLTTVEILDGFSKQNKASYGDIMANAAGTSLYVSQELIWKEQRIKPKFSFHSTSFFISNPRTMRMQIEQEFDGQTFWLSANLNSFLKTAKIPEWVNIAFGYGVEGMDYENDSYKNSLVSQKFPYRQFYVSLDVDLTKIKTNSSFLKTIFYFLNTLKFPAPTLEFTRDNRLKWHLVYF